jgi:hypothetical protein
VPWVVMFIWDWAVTRYSSPQAGKNDPVDWPEIDIPPRIHITNRIIPGLQTG